MPNLLRVLLLATLALGCTGCDAIRSLIESISDGAECTSDGQCLGGACLRDFPGGYCTTADCVSVGCSNIFGSECLYLPGEETPLCYEDCASSADCRAGYACFGVDTASVCLPASYVGVLAAAGALGSACGSVADCSTGACLTNLVGGYCSTLGCASDADCAGGRCLQLDGGDGGVEATACFRGCADDDACRFGYTCVDPDGAGGVCVEAAAENQSPVRNPAGADDGAGCTVGINCKGGTCLRAEEGYPEGYCTTLDCTSIGCNAPSGRTAQCRTIAQETACYVDCGADADCRTGYTCAGADLGGGYCAPPLGSNGPQPIEGDDQLVPVCDTARSGDVHTLAFAIDASTTAFSVVPYSDEASVRPLRLRLPDGTVGADFNGDYAFLDVNPEFIGSVTPVFFPAAPQFGAITEQGGGAYELDVQSTDSSLCYYVLQKPADGVQLAINVYFVGADGLSAQDADAHTGFQSMMGTFRSIYSSAGIDIDQVRLFDADATTAERYAIIRDLNDLYRIVGVATEPGPTLEEQLSVDVFLINGFAVPQAPGLLGVSLGIPGVPGLHGVPGSALVFTAEYLASNAAQTGQTMAHEIGHFNGLRHTSEHGGASWDPLSDTPQCSDPERGAACADATNLMFPFSLGNTQETVTAGQAAVLRASPHVR